MIFVSLKNFDQDPNEVLTQWKWEEMETRKWKLHWSFGTIGKKISRKYILNSNTYLFSFIFIYFTFLYSNKKSNDI